MPMMKKCCKKASLWTLYERSSHSKRCLQRRHFLLDKSARYSRKQGFAGDILSSIVAKEASTMHCKRCIVAKEASAAI